MEEEKRNLCTSEMKYGVGAKPRLANSVLPGFTRSRGASGAAKPPLGLLATLKAWRQVEVAMTARNTSHP